MGVAFRGILWGKDFCLTHSSFNSCFDLLCLGFNSPTLPLPGAGVRSSSFSRFLSRETYADLGACPEVKSFVLVFVVLNSRFRFLNMFPNMFLALPLIGADTGVPSRE